MADDEALEIGGQVLHCGRAMDVKSRRLWWSGNDEAQAVTLACATCGATGLLTVTTPVGPPGASRE